MRGHPSYKITLSLQKEWPNKRGIIALQSHFVEGKNFKLLVYFKKTHTHVCLNQATLLTMASP